MNAVKILSKKLNECKNTFVAYGGVRTHLLMNEELQKPSEKCPVCTNGYFMVRLNNQNTLKTLIDSLKDIKLEGEVTVQVGEQYFILTRLMYDVEFEDNLEMEMKELGIEQGTQITVTNDDDDQDKCYSVMLFVSVWKKDRVEYEGDRKLKPRPRFEEHKEEVEEGLDSKGFKKIKGGVIEIDGDEIVPISLD
jgi:ubiquitin-like 1-activating enzyme E1 B